MAETPGRVTLWGIEVFSAVSEDRSISAAAKRLGASPSAVSQQLTNLETALATQLIDRSARPIALTPAGELFRRRARVILDEAEEARVELANRDMSRLVRFNLGMIEDFDADVTPRLLSDMGDRLIGTRFLLETGASHRLSDLLEHKALDIIVASEQAAATQGMEVHPLLKEPFVAAAPKGLIGKHAALDALRQVPFIHYTTRHLMGRQIAEHLTAEGVSLDYRYELDSYHSIMAMVAAGAGWSILTPLAVMRAARFMGEVDVVPLPVAPMSRRISLIARKDSLYGMPAEVAERLRPLLRELIVAPCRKRMPFLGDSLAVL